MGVLVTVVLIGLALVVGRLSAPEPESDDTPEPFGADRALSARDILQGAGVTPDASDVRAMMAVAAANGQQITFPEELEAEAASRRRAAASYRDEAASLRVRANQMDNDADHEEDVAEDRESFAALADGLS